MISSSWTTFLKSRGSQLFCCRSSAEKRLHFLLKDFCDIILCRYSLALRDKNVRKSGRGLSFHRNHRFGTSFNLVQWRASAWRSCEPYTISFLGLGRWKRYFRALIAKEKGFPFICCNFTIFVSERQVSFPLFVCFFKSGSFFVSMVSILYWAFISTLSLQIQEELCSSVVCRLNLVIPLTTDTLF